MLCGDAPRLISDSFCKDFDSELVLNTDVNSFLTYFDFFGSPSNWDFSVIGPSKSWSRLTYTELLIVTIEASFADFFAGYWAYFSNIPNLGAWVKLTVGNYFGIPTFGFINGWDRIYSKVNLLLGSTTSIFFNKSFAYKSLNDSGNVKSPFDIFWYVFSTAAV